jgi:hypothetical protein
MRRRRCDTRVWSCADARRLAPDRCGSHVVDVTAIANVVLATVVANSSDRDRIDGEACRNFCAIVGTRYGSLRSGPLRP